MSAFLRECWRMVGTEAANPKAVDDLFKELQRLREEAPRHEAAKQALDNDLKREMAETMHLRNEVRDLRDREKRQAATISDVERLKLQLKHYQEREDLHIRPLFSALREFFVSPEEAEDILSLQRRLNRAREYGVVSAPKNAPAEEQLSELERARAENARLREVLEGNEKELRIIRDPERAELDRLKAANKTLSAAVELWKNSLDTP